MLRPSELARISSPDIDSFANEVAMGVWNRLAELPEFQHLRPQHYPRLFETVQNVLKRYHKKTP
jgi:hypothetical protein